MLDHLAAHLRTAGEVLTSQDLPLQVSLVEAGNEFWATMDHPEEWPAELRPKVHHLLDQLLASGTVQTTVAQMDFEAVREAAQGILTLAAEVEARRSAQRHRSRT